MGLDTSSDILSPRANPFIKEVLPPPKSPIRENISPPCAFFASFSPKAAVSDTDLVIICMGLLYGILFVRPSLTGQKGDSMLY